MSIIEFPAREHLSSTFRSRHLPKELVIMQTQRRIIRGIAVALGLVVSVNGASAQSVPRGQLPETRLVTTNEVRASTYLSLHSESHMTRVPARFAPLPAPRQISRRKAITLGIVIGGAVGATAGYFISRDDCASCDDSGPVVLVASAAGLAGAALGGFVGAMNAPTDPARSAFRERSTTFLSVPHPVATYHLASFR